MLFTECKPLFPRSAHTKWSFQHKSRLQAALLSKATHGPKFFGAHWKSHSHSDAPSKVEIFTKT